MLELFIRSVSSDFTNKKKNFFSWKWSATRIELKKLANIQKNPLNDVQKAGRTIALRPHLKITRKSGSLEEKEIKKWGLVKDFFTVLYSDFLYSCKQQGTIKMETKIQLMVPIIFSISAIYKHQTSERYFSLRHRQASWPFSSGFKLQGLFHCLTINEEALQTTTYMIRHIISEIRWETKPWFLKSGLGVHIDPQRGRVFGFVFGAFTWWAAECLGSQRWP